LFLRIANVHRKPPILTNREVWEVSITVLNSTTDEAMDITGASISLGVRDKKSGSEVLSATVGDGITISGSETGVFEWSFPDEDTHGLCPGTYDVGIVVTLNGSVIRCAKIYPLKVGLMRCSL
jgi:hypothetical protein